MAIFTNVATLSYGNTTVVSNTVTGELLETLAVAKAAIEDNYTVGQEVTYVISIRNTGTTAFTNLTVTDDLGGYLTTTTTLYPLTYVAGSVAYYVDGVQQADPAVSAGPPLTFTGINVPAGGNAFLVYKALVNTYASPVTGSSITNTVTITGGGLGAPVTAQTTIGVVETAVLGISKALSPATVSENDTLTYTFMIENTGNTAATAADGIVVNDVFAPVLENITVTLNGVALTAGTDYTYNAASGVFTTVAGKITVPAATYTQNTDGTWTVIPGVAVLSITGTV